MYPTLSDTLPLVILEAMASGLPVISTKVGGIPYQVDRSCGVLVDSGNPQAIAEAFEQLTENKQKLAAMSSAAYQMVRARFDWDRSAQQAFTFYQNLLQSSSYEKFDPKSTTPNFFTLR